MNAEIEFYSVGDDYGWMSNFAAYPIHLDGHNWPTTEHYFQAQKFPGDEVQSRIRQLKSPMEAAKIGRDRKLQLRGDWESVKDALMRKAVLAKFSQHRELQEQLLATGDAKLIEHTKNDSYWGDGGDGSGKNMLGGILMEVRQKLRSESVSSV